MFHLSKGIISLYMKKIVTVLLLFIFTITVVIYAFMYFQKQSTDDVTDVGSKFGLLKTCPDEWIVNRQPTIEGTLSNEQYFIFNGERREVDDYNINWIRANCGLEIQEVY